MTTYWARMPEPRPPADDLTARRLDQFRREHPAVTICPPTAAHARWRAFIGPRTVPGDDREMVITDPEMGPFTGRLEKLFRRRKPGRGAPPDTS